MSPQTPTTALFEALRRYIAETYGQGVLPTRVAIWIPLDPEPITLPVPGVCLPGRQDDTLEMSADDARTDTAEDVLDVLREADRPLKGRAIANRAGRNYGSHFRGVLSKLRKDGRVELVDDGYRLAGGRGTGGPADGGPTDTEDS